MKFYNIAEFEKLKIRPVNISNIKQSEDIVVEKLDLNKLCFEDIKPGYIIQTRYGWAGDVDNLFIVVPIEYLKKLKPEYRIGMYDVILVRPNYNYKHLVSESMHGYVAHFPKHLINSDMDIQMVYKTHIDFTKFKSETEFIEYFKKIEAIMKNENN